MFLSLTSWDWLFTACLNLKITLNMKWCHVFWVVTFLIFSSWQKAKARECLYSCWTTKYFWSNAMRGAIVRKSTFTILPLVGLGPKPSPVASVLRAHSVSQWATVAVAHWEPTTVVKWWWRNDGRASVGGWVDASQVPLGLMHPGEQLPGADHGTSWKRRRVFKASVTKNEELTLWNPLQTWGGYFQSNKLRH